MNGNYGGEILDLFENERDESHVVAEVLVGKVIPIHKHGETDYLADWGQADSSQSIELAQLVNCHVIH